MKNILIVSVLVLLLISPSLTDASTRVRSYTTKRGTYVPSHYKTSPNRTKVDNWSTKGNYNPYTGKKGYKNW